MKLRIVSALLASSVLIGATRARIAAHPITGHIVDAVHGTPIAGALVILPGVDTTRTAADGSFRIPDLTANANVLLISRDGYPALRIPELIAPTAGNLDVAVRLRSSTEPVDLAGHSGPLVVMHLRPDSETIGIEILTDSNLVALPIAGINVLKGSHAIDAFGDAGAHGVICIALTPAVRKSRAC